LEKILTISQLHKRYKKVHAVNNLSLEIHKGNVYGLLGPNGSGKSTTLGMVLNVVNKTSGDYFWFDGSLTTHEALKKVGAIIERPNFYPYMTARENLSLVAKIKGVNSNKILEKLTLVGLADRADSKFNTFSLGMKQRLAIASALLNDPEILILDEPTNGLDPNGIRQIRDLIKEIAAQGTTILLASHLLDEVEKVCSHVVVLQKGKMLYSGPVKELTDKQQVFELASKDATALKTALEKHPEIENLNLEGDVFLVSMKKEMSSGELNRYCFEQGITLEHLKERKISLEEQFLKLTQN
jgi:ABC-2 type transport system ATP-binding protein